MLFDEDNVGFFGKIARYFKALFENIAGLFYSSNEEQPKANLQSQANAIDLLPFELKAYKITK